MLKPYGLDIAICGHHYLLEKSARVLFIHQVDNKVMASLMLFFQHVTQYYLPPSPKAMLQGQSFNHCKFHVHHLLYYSQLEGLLCCMFYMLFWDIVTILSCNNYQTTMASKTLYNSSSETIQYKYSNYHHVQSH